MQITQVRIRLANEDFVKAYASICFDDCFLVHNEQAVLAEYGKAVPRSENQKAKAGN
jgi:DNA-binding cell septation regulator SpoVG